VSFWDAVNPVSWIEKGVSTVLKPIGESITSWQQRKTVRTQAKMEVEILEAKAKVKEAESKITRSHTSEKVLQSFKHFLGITHCFF